MNYYLKYFSINFFIMTTLYFFSCKESSKFEPLLTPYNQLPVVSGIVITDAAANELAVWRNPSENGSMSNKALLYSPYPNPTNGHITIRFNLFDDLTISSWIVPGIMEGEDITKGKYSNNARPKQIRR